MQAKQMENNLYRMMAEFGGMEIPMNQPAGGSNNIRLRSRGGERASDIPLPMVVDEPVNTNAN
jgi:N-acetylglucosamine-6-sulfatase